MAVRMSIRGPETRYERVGTVVLLDEHPIWLDALERVLEDAGINVVGRTTCPETMLRLIECEGPDALVTSIELPPSPMDGVECIRRARERAPQLRIVALSTQHDAFHLASAATAGAHAYPPETAAASGARTRACRRPQTLPSWRPPSSSVWSTTARDPRARVN